MWFFFALKIIQIQEIPVTLLILLDVANLSKSEFLSPIIVERHFFIFKKQPVYYISQILNTTKPKPFKIFFFYNFLVLGIYRIRNILKLRQMVC